VEFADVDGEGGQGYGVEVLRAHCLVGAQQERETIRGRLRLWMAEVSDSRSGEDERLQATTTGGARPELWPDG